MRTLIIAALTALFAAAPVLAKPITYTLDPAHTQVRVVWNHFGFSNPGANFTDVTGTLVYDAEHPTQASVKVTIPLAGLDAHVPALTRHLKQADFFDAAKFPMARFVSTHVSKTGPDKLTVNGNLTVHGVTRPVTLAVTINKIGVQKMRGVPAAGFDATTTLKRSDFGVGAYAPSVSDQVRVHITTEAIEAKAYAEAARRK
jgi:polyisoprenoid-binding protein YceI